MEITIYGPGCKNCVSLADNAKKALAETGVDAEIVKVEDMKEIAIAGIMSTPAIAIDGEIKIKGRVATVDEIKKLIS
ncbi:MAG: redox-active disulfide protein 2 [Halanaerobium sp. 4-GBenrich]|jgi:small redox-active disulfide protein 2|uniref:Small redox-active disulfide protein 2 n=1 Tax=Halanaerobium congolense TaxID=54121 RepID=A0A1G6LLK6_9FIRM|nr:thioredoxin family protein [Halanaerobium congolense]KXS49800.1 MAG: redox-active disulfide protein 2 [Halanaerobium sp. T82-1]ODS50318.1 MAG: redox-active disulfide protein 2 [Halanaerobium sp. 4-GBenrich]OEG63325.1 MAG: redox-active disulfide protein 2 [Halanaerobium sp. MDAL1]PUU93122.1 MAG: redox-active disulfide protein 2 [Halanaerobium sp.]PTX15657.1 small redox-active disulfide protein 2 [Halanaerobium congolense]